MILPADVWLKIIEQCEADDIVRLSRCCKTLYDLSQNCTVWLEALYRLEQHEAPRVLPHVPVTSYDAVELRRIVVDARRAAKESQKRKLKKKKSRKKKPRRKKLNNSEEHPQPVTKQKRTVRIPLADVNPDDVLGELRIFGLELFLLPGNNHLIIAWPAGYITLWDISNPESEPKLQWLYPDYPDGASEERPLLVQTFHYEMQENGDIYFLLVNELLQGDLLGERYIDILSLSPDTGVIDILKSGEIDHLAGGYGPPEIVKIHGNITAVYQELYSTMEGALTISLWRDNLSLTLTEAALDTVELTDGFVICIRREDPWKGSIAVISVEDVCQELRTKGSSTKELKDFVSLEYSLGVDTAGGQRPALAVCSYHWRPKAMRDKVGITVTAETRSPVAKEGIFIAHFLLTKGKKPSLQTVTSEMWKFASPDEQVLENNRVLDVLPGWTSHEFKPIVLYKNNPDEKDEVKLASLSITHDMTLKTSDLRADSVELSTIRTEFYSGSLVYATKNYEDVIVELS